MKNYMKKLFELLVSIGALSSAVYADAALPSNKPLNTPNLELYIYGGLIIALIVAGIIVIVNKKKKAGK